MKKFEEGVFSDLRNLKPGVDACLEEPKVSTFFPLIIAIKKTEYTNVPLSLLSSIFCSNINVFEHRKNRRYFTGMSFVSFPTAYRIHLLK